MHGKKEIVFLTSGKTPYRSLFFKEFSKYCKLKVFYELERSGEREWVVESGENEMLEERVMKSVRKNINSALCPEVIKHIKGKNKLIIVGGYSTPTGMLAIAWMRLHRKKYILNADGGLIKNDKWLQRKIKRYFISGASHWLSSGKKTTEYLVHYGAKAERIIEYPFASTKAKDILDKPLGAEEKKKIREQLDIHEERIILAVGQFIHRKGFDVLLNTDVLKNENIGLYIVGGIPTEEYIKIKEKRALDNVHFVGFKQREELEKYYLAADVFVLPTREDIWGLVINEAMAKGLPVITTDRCVAGLELIRDGENGYIVPTENAEALSEAIAKIVEEDKLMEKMSDGAINAIKNYSIEKMAEVHADAIKGMS